MNVISLFLIVTKYYLSIWYISNQVVLLLYLLLISLHVLPSLVHLILGVGLVVVGVLLDLVVQDRVLEDRDLAPRLLGILLQEVEVDPELLLLEIVRALDDQGLQRVEVVDTVDLRLLDLDRIALSV